MEGCRKIILEKLKTEFKGNIYYDLNASKVEKTGIGEDIQRIHSLPMLLVPL